jgi:hypothetical protein
VRNPITWYESWWKFMAGKWRAWEEGRWHPQRPIDHLGDDDFNTFVENVLRERPGYVSEMYGWYTSGVSFVGRFECLREDLVRGLEAGGMRVDARVLDRVPPSNVSKARLGNPTWDPAVLERTIAAEAAAIARYAHREEVERIRAERKLALRA